MWYQQIKIHLIFLLKRMFTNQPSQSGSLGLVITLLSFRRSGFSLHVGMCGVAFTFLLHWGLVQPVVQHGLVGTGGPWIDSHTRWQVESDDRSFYQPAQLVCIFWSCGNLDELRRRRPRFGPCHGNVRCHTICSILHCYSPLG